MSEVLTSKEAGRVLLRGKRGRYNSNASICFDCAKAVCGCSWSREFLVPEGCEFEIVAYNHASDVAWNKFRDIRCDITYRILSCPLFEEDEERGV